MNQKFTSFLRSFFLLSSIALICLTSQSQAQTAGGALNFNGTDDFVNLGPNISSAGSFSWEAWIKTSGNGTIIAKCPEAGGWYWGGKTLFVRQGRISYDAFGISYVETPGTYNDGLWHHVALTVQSNYSGNLDVVSIYVDGSLKVTRDNWDTNASSEAGQVTKIGYTNSNFPEPGFLNGVSPFTGTIDEVRIWDRALTGSEIAGRMSCELALPQTGLLAYYKFNQGIASDANPSVNTVWDYSGNNKNGTLNSFALTGPASNWVAGQIKACTLTGPANISSGISLWLDASDVTATGNNSNIANGSSLPVWSDKSGSSHDAVKLSGQNGVTYVSGQINGKSVIRFTRLGDNLGSVLLANGVDIRAGSNPDVTMFTVYKQGAKVAVSGQGQALWGNDDGNWDRFFYNSWSHGDNGIASLGPVNPTFVDIIGAGTVGKLRLMTAVFDGTVSGGANNGPPLGSAIYFDGVVVTKFTDHTEPSAAQTSLRIGNDGDNGNFNGDIAEMIVYNRKLSDCEIQTINQYLSTKYGVTFTSAAITASGPTTICQGASVTLTASAGSSYQWFKDGSPIAAATSATYNATSAGSYTVNITNTSGCSATSLATLITVNPVQDATITTSGPVTFCTGGSVTLNANTGASYLWSNGSTSQTITATSPGNYWVKVTNAAGCTSTSASTTVSINPLPVVSIVPTTSAICAGGSTTLRANTGGGNALTFNGANTYVDLGTGVTLPTTFTQEAWIYSSAGNDGKYHGFLGTEAGVSRSPSMWVYNEKVIHGGFGDGSRFYYYHTGEVILPNTWNHIAQTYNGTTLTCYVNGVVAYSSNEFAGKIPAPTAVKSIGRVDNYFQGALDEVRMWNVTRTQAQIQADMNRTISPSSAGLVAYYKLDEGTGSTTVNAVTASSGTLTNGPVWSISSAPVGATVTWSPAAGLNTTNGAIAIATPTATTTYTATATDASTGCVSTATQTITVNTVTATASNSGAVISGGTIMLASTGTGTFSWTGPNSFTSTLQNPVIANATTANAGTYNVTVTQNGCTATASTNVIVNTVLAGALNLDASKSNKIAVSSGGLPTGNSTYAIEAWIKPTSTSVANAIVGWGNWGATDQVNCFRLSGPTTLINYWWGHDLVVTVPNLLDGKWHHVVASFDGTTRSIYTDGVLRGSDKPTGHNVPYSTNATIGSANPVDGYGEYFDGSIDEVRIWNRPLCQGEIENNRAGELSLPQTGLAAYYKFNQGNSNDVNTGIKNLNDASGNNNNGALQGFELSGTTSNWVDGTVTGTSPVFLPPTATIAASGATTFCPSESVTLTANSGEGFTYQWTKDGLSIPGAVNNTYAATASGKYNVIITKNGCTATATPIIVVVEDKAPPVITSNQGDVVVALNTSGSATLASYIGLATATDNCTAASSIVFTQLPAPGTVLGQNVPTTVTIKATDASGNSSLQTFTVTATDQTAPVVLTMNTNIQLNASGNAVLKAEQINNGSTDNVGITSLALDKTNFNCADITASPTDYKEFFTFVSDATWRQSTTVKSSVEVNGFWNGVSSVPDASTYTIIPTIGAYYNQIIPGTQGILVGDNVRFLRKTINISNASNLRVTLLASVDNDVQLFVNGTEVAVEGDLAVENFNDQVHSRVVLNENTPNQNGGTGFQPFDRITNIKASNLFHPGENDVVFAIRNTPDGDRGAISFKVIFEKAGSGVPVTLTATDQAGNTTSALAYVVVEDKIAPAKPTLADLTGECSVTAIAPTTTDNCSGIVTGTTTDALTYTTQGTRVINWTFTDASGNVTTATQNVTILDITSPVITSVQQNVVVALNASGTAALANYIPSATATDNCTAAGSIVFTQSPAAGTPLVPNVPLTVTLTATDANGLKATQTFTVTATDQTSPVVKTKNITVPLDAYGKATVVPSQVDGGTYDNSGSFTLNLDKTTFDCSNLGVNPVTLTAADASGNTTASVIPAGLIGLWDFEDAGKLKDQTGNWGDLILSGSATISAGALDANTGMARTSSYSGAEIRSKTLISYVSLDKLAQGAGSAMTIDRINSDSFDGLIYAEAQPNRWMNGSSNGLRNQNLNPGYAETSPNQLVQVALTYEEKPGNQVLITFYRNGATYGSYLANNFTSWSANDAEILFGARHYYGWVNQQVGSLDAHIQKAMLFNRALTATEIQSLHGPVPNAVVTVVDTIKPVAPVLADVIGECSATAVTPSTTDNCAATVVGTTTDALTYTTQGTHVITWSFDDGHGNVSTATQNVVVKDVTPPVFVQPTDINVIATSAAGAVVNYTAPVGADNCSATTTMTAGLASGSIFPIGTTKVTYTTTDIAGLTASTSFEVTVTGIAPSIVVPENISVNNTAGECGAVASFAATETRAIPASAITYSIQPGSNFTVGTTEVTATATNAVGTSTGTFTVTVIDNEAPVIVNNGDKLLNTDSGVCGAKVEVSATATDNCSVGNPVGKRSDGLALDAVYPVGTTTISWNVSDIHGNIATESTQTVIVEDHEAPRAIAQNVTVQLDAYAKGSTTAEAVNNGSNDACGIESIKLSKTDFDCSNFGANEVTLTVTDIH
ncbi:MAG: hypothetical protein K0S09_1261, partial [Sphingobacteriaceae bacterium]|nr:hypothetical protein [Sphingobacteriaceae bacterium]